MASAYLTRTVTASTATSYTVSFWVKINNVNDTSTPYLWSIGSSAGNGIYLDSDGKIDFFRQSDTSYLTLYDGVLRDPSAWYHIVWSVNAGTGTAYVNGVTGNSHSSIPALNDNTGTKINIHSYVTGAYNTLDCCMAHFHFIDSTAYDASTFGESDSVSGIWKPKTAPSVTYGTNGFFLKMENSGAMGTDSSGNSNTFTVSGTLTQNVDTPSNNFSTLTPLVSRKGTLTNANLTHEGSGATAPNNVISSLGVTSGKFYVEAKIKTANNYNGVGICSLANTNINSGSGYVSGSVDSLLYVYSDIYHDGGTVSGTYATLATDDVVRVALDLDNGYVYFGVNETWQNSSNPESGASGTGGIQLSTYFSSGVDYFLCAETGGASNTRKIEFNFGQGYFGTTQVASAGTAPSEGGIFEFDCPSGYQALCTKGINSF